MLFPAINLGELIVTLGYYGVEEFFSCFRDPDRTIPHWMLFVITVVNGIALPFHLWNMSMGMGHDDVDPSLPRFFLATSGLLVLSRTGTLASMVDTFRIAMSSAMALVFVLALFMAIFAIFTKKMYGPGTYDVDQFITYRQALFSAFQIFTGNWHDIMYAASDATERETTKLPFVLFCTLVTFFFCQLFVGVLLTTFQEVQVVATHIIEGKLIPATRLYGVLDSIYRHWTESERESLVEDFLAINYELTEVNRDIAGLSIDERQAKRLEKP